MPSPLAGRRRIVGAVVVALLAILTVVAIVMGGSDEDEISIVRGSPDAGFPLRGDRAGDDAMIRGAVGAWSRRQRRDGGVFAGDRRGEVTVLWAGRTGAETDAVVLAADLDAAVVTRSGVGGPRSWRVVDASIGSAEDPIVVASENAVLTRADASAGFRRARPDGVGSPVVRETAGLWHQAGTGLPDGAVLLPRGLRSRVRSDRLDPAAVFTGDVAAVRRLSTGLFRRLRSGSASREGPDALRLVAAARGAAADRDAGAGTAPGVGVRPGESPVLDLLSDRVLAPVGPVLILAVGTGREERRSLVAALGGEAVANGEDPTAIRFGDGRPGGLRGRTGPAFGAAHVGGATSGGGASPPFLLVAGDDDVARIEVLVGRRTIRRPGPVALVPAPWARPGGSTTDVAVLGRTARGELVVPTGATPTAASG